MMANPSTGWKYVFQKIDENGLGHQTPACTRFHNHVDIYYITKDNKIRNVYTNNPNSSIGSIKYKYSTIYESTEEKKISSLTALRTSQYVIDIYFLSNGHWVHGSAGEHNGWKYNFTDIKYYKGLMSAIKMVPMRYGDYIDLFFADN